MTRRLFALTAVIGVFRLIASSVHSEIRTEANLQPSPQYPEALAENSRDQAAPLRSQWMIIETKAKEAGPTGPASEVK